MAINKAKPKTTSLDQARATFGKALGERLPGGLSSKEMAELYFLAAKLDANFKKSNIAKGDSENADQLNLALRTVFQALPTGEERRFFEPMRALLVSTLRDGKIDPSELQTLRKEVVAIHQGLLDSGRIEAATQLETSLTLTIEALGAALSSAPMPVGELGWQSKAESSQEVLRANRVRVTGEDPAAVKALEYLKSNEATNDLAKMFPYHFVSLVDPKIMSGTRTIAAEYSSRWPDPHLDIHVPYMVQELLKKKGLDGMVWVDLRPTAATAAQDNDLLNVWKHAQASAEALPKNAFEFRFGARATAVKTFDPVQALDWARAGHHFEVFRIAEDGTKAKNPIAAFDLLPTIDNRPGKPLYFHPQSVAQLFQKLTDTLASGK